ncbi:ABC transporter permease subunit [Tahibacter harae]|uniref:ABC transporter permease subunit n=1 Tax=Tahibacter harae TaxID=2963937 RepID=A0ABT1QTY3_9GAMM|nr:ABC transporter permease subunit [Tahibacter harae]MCQ4165755.1 ABC transporter permease subunit [Tahibacter harae]
MSALLLIAAHEWRRLCAQAWTWFLLAGLLAVLAWIFLSHLDNFLLAQAGSGNTAAGVTSLVAVPLLGRLVLLLLLLVPLLGARLIAGERRAHTLNLLLASGVSDAAIIGGKWLGLWLWLLLLIALTVLMPLCLAGATSLDLGRLAANVLALCLLAGTLAAIALYASSVCAQPVLATALALLINAVFCLIDLGARAAGLRHGLINWLSLPTHYEGLMEGVVASGDLAWFAIVGAVFLALATRQLASLRSAD